MRFTAALAAMLLAASTALAGNTWDGGANPDGNWSNNANWNSDTPPNYGTFLTFGGTTGLNSTNNGATTSMVGLTFSSGAGAFNLNGSSVTLGGNIANNSTTLQTVNLPLVLDANRQVNPNSGDLVLGGPVSGGFSLIQAASGGTVTLNTAGSSFSLYQFNRGTSKLGVNNALPTSGGLTFATAANPATLDLNGKTQTIGAVTFAGSGATADITDTAGGGLLKLGSSVTQNASGVPTVTISAALDLNGATRTFNLNHTSGGTITVTGPITNSTGTAGLTKAGVGTLILAGTNTYTGDTTVSTGTLKLSNSKSIHQNSALKLAAGTTLNLDFAGTMFVSSCFTNGVALPVGDYTAANLGSFISGPGTLHVGVSAGMWDGGGSDNNWSTGGNWDNDVAPLFPLGLTFGGSTRLTPNNDFTGVAVNGITFASGAGAFALNGSGVTLGGNITNSSTSLQTVNLPLVLDADRQVRTASGGIVLGGQISGAFTLIQVGTGGSLTLNTAGSSFNLYQINSGTTKLGVNDALPTTKGLTFATATAATLDLNGKTQTLGGPVTVSGSAGTVTITDTAGGGLIKLGSNVTQNVTSAPAVTIAAALDLNGTTRIFNLNNASGTITVSGPITNSTGTAGLTKAGVGTLVLSGTNTYPGDTTVNAGTLVLADNAQLKFVIGANGVNNQVAGTATVNLDGDFNLDLSGADTTVGNSWTLVDVPTLTETFGATFTVLGFTETSSGVWKQQIDAGKRYVFTEATGILGVQANTAPVAKAISMGARAGVLATLPIIGGKHAPTDADGDAVTLLSVSNPSANGGAVVINGGSVDYTAAASFSGTDTFDYTVSDGFGGTDTKTITVTVTSANAASLNVVYGPTVEGSDFVVRFAGVPGTTYTVETNAAFSGPGWAKFNNYTAPTELDSHPYGVGIFQVTKPDAGEPSLYFRTIHPSY